MAASDNVDLPDLGHEDQPRGSALLTSRRPRAARGSRF